MPSPGASPRGCIVSDENYARIAAAIEYLIANRDRQPSLDDAAAHVGLSRYHFQRLFKSYAGVTPKQFLASITLQSAKSKIDASASVLDAALDVGLSSPSRLHDHFVTIDAMSPGEYKERGLGLTVTYGFAWTPFGLLRAAQTPRGIAMVDFVDAQEPIHPTATPLPLATFERDDRVAERIAARAFDGSEASVKLHVHGTNFQLRVWNALLALDPGERITYAGVAEAIGAPQAARAVGNAVAVNPVALFIPCHRVIAASGVIGNYKWGSSRKRALLAWEHAAQKP